LPRIVKQDVRAPVGALYVMLVTKWIVILEWKIAILATKLPKNIAIIAVNFY
jgi:hypothetical protein